MNNFLHPGQGDKLRAAAASGAITNPHTQVIPAGGYTEPVAGHDCIELSFLAVINAVGATTVTIQYSPTTDFSNADDVETVAVASNSARWNAGEYSNGFYRARNNSAATATVYAQKRIN